jgi:hypothetical protein
MERALVVHFGYGATAHGIAWLVGLVARVEECERRIAELNVEIAAMPEPPSGEA